MEHAQSLEQAIAIAESVSEAKNIDEVMVIGGAQIYQQALPKADVLYLTCVEAEVFRRRLFFQR